MGKNQSQTTTPVMFLAGSLVAAIFGVVGVFVDVSLPAGLEAELSVVVATVLAWLLPAELRDSIPSRRPKV
jgi:urea transporter